MNEQGNQSVIKEPVWMGMIVIFCLLTLFAVIRIAKKCIKRIKLKRSLDKKVPESIIRTKYVGISASYLRLLKNSRLASLDQLDPPSPPVFSTDHDLYNERVPGENLQSETTRQVDSNSVNLQLLTDDIGRSSIFDIPSSGHGIVGSSELYQPGKIGGRVGGTLVLDVTSLPDQEQESPFSCFNGGLRKSFTYSGPRDQESGLTQIDVSRKSISFDASRRFSTDIRHSVNSDLSHTTEYKTNSLPDVSIHNSDERSGNVSEDPLTRIQLKSKRRLFALSKTSVPTSVLSDECGQEILPREGDPLACHDSENETVEKNSSCEKQKSGTDDKTTKLKPGKKRHRIRQNNPGNKIESCNRSREKYRKSRSEFTEDERLGVPSRDVYKDNKNVSKSEPINKYRRRRKLEHAYKKKNMSQVTQHADSNQLPVNKVYRKKESVLWDECKSPRQQVSKPMLPSSTKTEGQSRPLWENKLRVNDVISVHSRQKDSLVFRRCKSPRREPVNVPHLSEQPQKTNLMQGLNYSTTIERGSESMDSNPSMTAVLYEPLRQIDSSLRHESKPGDGAVQDFNQHQENDQRSLSTLNPPQVDDTLSVLECEPVVENSLEMHESESFTLKDGVFESRASNHSSSKMVRRISSSQQTDSGMSSPLKKVDNNSSPKIDMPTETGGEFEHNEDYIKRECSPKTSNSHKGRVFELVVESSSPPASTRDIEYIFQSSLDSVDSKSSLCVKNSDNDSAFGSAPKTIPTSPALKTFSRRNRKNIIIGVTEFSEQPEVLSETICPYVNKTDESEIQPFHTRSDSRTANDDAIRSLLMTVSKKLEKMEKYNPCHVKKSTPARKDLLPAVHPDRKNEALKISPSKFLPGKASPIMKYKRTPKRNCLPNNNMLVYLKGDTREEMFV